MARGKMAARAAGRRAAEASDELAQARAEIARLARDMKALEVAHQSELQRQAGDHQAHVDAQVQERLDSTVERNIAAEVERRVDRAETDWRNETAETLRDWLRREDVAVRGPAGPNAADAFLDLAEALGVNAGDILRGAGSRAERRLTVGKARRNIGIKQQMATARPGHP